MGQDRRGHLSEARVLKLRSKSSCIPRHGVPSGMSRLHPEHTDSAPPDLLVAADVLKRQEPDEEEDEEEDDHNGKDDEDDEDDDDDENDDGYSE